MNIVLIGMRGSGKTAVGKVLAQRLGREFIELDELIVQKAGKSIPEIVAQHGWEKFRDLEEEPVVRQVRVRIRGRCQCRSQTRGYHPPPGRAGHGIVQAQPPGGQTRCTQCRCRATLAVERSGGFVPVLKEAAARASSVVTDLPATSA